jgi:hypothetical protein
MLRKSHRRCFYDTPVVADGVVRFIGEKVAAVAAETEVPRSRRWI